MSVNEEKILGIVIPNIEVNELLNQSESKISNAVNELSGQHNIFVQAALKMYTDNTKNIIKVTETLQKTLDKAVSDLAGGLTVQFESTKNKIVEITGLTKSFDDEIKSKAIMLAKIQKSIEALQLQYSEREKSAKADVELNVKLYKKSTIDSYMKELKLESFEEGYVENLTEKYNDLKINFD